jgi:hemoglobin
MKATMFERYGGFGVVHRIVLSFYDRMLDSDVVAAYFDNVDMEVLVDHQTKFISQVMGGPVAYSNEILEQVHRPLDVTLEAFEEMARLLEATLQEFGIKPEDVRAVMADIKSRQPFVVTTGQGRHEA